jgi:hypothetical protein
MHERGIWLNQNVFRFALEQSGSSENEFPDSHTGKQKMKLNRMITRKPWSVPYYPQNLNSCIKILLNK